MRVGKCVEKVFKHLLELAKIFNNFSQNQLNVNRLYKKVMKIKIKMNLNIILLMLLLV